MPIRRCVYIFLFLFSLHTQAQDLKIESLKKLSVDSLKSLAEKRKKLPLDSTLVNIYSILSSKHLYINNVETKKYSSLVLQLAKKINYEHGIASGTNDLALVILAEGDVNKAYKMLHSNLKYYYKVRDYVGLGTNYLSLGVVHGTQNEIKKAIESLNKALYFYKKGGAKNSRLAGCYSMLGNAYSYLNDEEKSIQNYLKALKLEDDDEDVITILNNLGKAFADFKKYDSAMHYYKKALLRNEKVKSSYDEMNSYSFIGDLYLKTGQPNKSVEYLKKGLILSEKENHIENKIEVNKNLSLAYEKLGNYKNALLHQQNYASLKDNLNKSSSIEEVKKIETKFELERQDAKLTLLENQKKLNEAEIKKSNLIMLLGGIVLLLSIILTWYWYRQHKTKTLLNKQQKEQFKTEIRLKEVESNLEGQLLERKRLAQELHDGLGATLAGIKLSTITYFSEKGEENKSLIDSLNTVCNDVRLMSHNLIPPEFSKESFEQIMKKLVQNYSAQSETKLHLNIDGSKDLERLNINQKTLLYRILQETITNAFKHAKCSDISLLITAFNDYITIIVEDNGIGFDSSKNQEGIGLKNIRERIQDLGSQLTIDTSLGNGTVIQFDIPLNQQQHG